jgi:hypothetical protein
MMAWGKVCQPLNLGGLGLLPVGAIFGSSYEMALASKMELTKAWADLPIQVTHKTKAFFSLAMSSLVGDGASAIFWQIIS